jgi:hypothetical protein
MARDRMFQVETQYVFLAVYQVWESITLIVISFTRDMNITLIVNFFTRDMNITLWMFINREL